MWGADVEALRTIANEFKLAASDLDTALMTAANEVATVVWEGTDATTFKTDFDDLVRLDGFPLAERLAEESESLSAHADAQEQASEGNPAQ